MRRQRFLLIAVLVLGLIALGRWAMLVEKAVDPPSAAAVVQVEPPPVATSPAVAEPVVEEKAKLPAGAILRGRVIDAATADPVRKFTLHFHWDRSTGYRESPAARTFDTD